MEFRVVAVDPSGARAGEMVTERAAIDTPYFQPVASVGAVRGVSWHALKKLRFPHVLMNTYHLVQRPGLERIAEAGGLGAFTGFNGSIQTDGGGYQVFSLAKKREIHERGVTFMSHLDGRMIEFTPESVARAHIIFASDIAMPLDILSPPGASHEEAARDLDLTTGWLAETKEYWEKNADEGRALFGVIQGGMFPDLRERAAGDATRLDLDGYAVGGLSVGESEDVFIRIAKLSAELLPEDKPRQLLGAGTPGGVIRAIALGYDLCGGVLPTRMARHHTAYTRFGKIDLRHRRFAGDENPVDPGCRCPLCKSHTRAYVHHLVKLHEINAPLLLAHHNLHFYCEIALRARDAIKRGRFKSFAIKWLKRMGEWNPERDGELFGV